MSTNCRLCELFTGESGV